MDKGILPWVFVPPKDFDIAKFRETEHVLSTDKHVVHYVVLVVYMRSTGTVHQCA